MDRLVSRQARADDRALATWMQAAQSGDAQAYARLLREIAPRLRQFIRSQRRTFNAADAEDLVQDVLLSLHTVRATYDPQRPFMPWLLSIAHNRMVDAARRYGRGAAHELQVENLSVTFADDGTNTGGEVYRDPDLLTRAIRQLPPRQREAIEMLKLRELSLKEAAAASGTSVASLKVSVHRAVANLRKVLLKNR
jgi:RNA polymerase sigma factor (sigma-70 family)